MKEVTYSFVEAEIRPIFVRIKCCLCNFALQSQSLTLKMKWPMVNARSWNRSLILERLLSVYKTVPFTLHLLLTKIHFFKFAIFATNRKIPEHKKNYVGIIKLMFWKKFSWQLFLDISCCVIVPMWQSQSPDY